VLLIRLRPTRESKRGHFTKESLVRFAHNVLFYRPYKSKLSTVINKKARIFDPCFL
jgi:hypothetical protein